MIISDSKCIYIIYIFEIKTNQAFVEGLIDSSWIWFGVFVQKRLLQT